MQDDYSPDQTRSGNRCGHDPKNPRWFAPPSEHAPRPPIIGLLIERLRDFYTHPEKIPSLANVLFGRQATLDDSDRRPRQMRSERREACCSLLGAIAHYCDLPSLCLSVPQADGSLLPIRLDTLAEAAGLTLRRAERAIRDIIDAGLLGVHPRCEQQADGSYIGRAAIRVVPTVLFGLFGLEARLDHDRRRISQARREREPTRTEKARFKTTIQSALSALMGNRPQPQPAAARVTPPPLVMPEPQPRRLGCRFWQPNIRDHRSGLTSTALGKPGGGFFHAGTVMLGCPSTNIGGLTMGWWMDGWTGNPTYSWPMPSGN